MEVARFRAKSVRVRPALKRGNPKGALQGWLKRLGFSKAWREDPDFAHTQFSKGRRVRDSPGAMALNMRLL